MYAPQIKQLIQAFTKLPGVGKRTAERFVFALLNSGKQDVAELSSALQNLVQSVQSCSVCWNFSDQSPCRVCSDPKKNHHSICVVETPQDLEALEKIGLHDGVYHVLRGVIRPADETWNKRLKTTELFTRLKQKNNQSVEVILALNLNLAGETTMMLLTQKIKEEFPQVRVSRLARGLPMGSDLQYADEVTLKSAFTNRRQ